MEGILHDIFLLDKVNAGCYTSSCKGVVTVSLPVPACRSVMELMIERFIIKGRVR